METPDCVARYVLGLDLGAESLGWQLLRLDNGRPSAIACCGVHTFDASVEGGAAAIEKGNDEPKAKARRDARGPRRTIWRRARRRGKLLRILQRAGLMPLGPTNTPEAIDSLMKKLDLDLRARVVGSDRVAAHVWPYRLRAKALDAPLEPFELGRAFYHLAQRRGFLSNRKAVKKGEDEGTVKSAIGELEQRIAASGARTLGEYFSTLDPEAERIRRRWTGRAMYIAEFERIWNAQAPHHPCLTTELKQAVYHAIYHQRPLKPQGHLVGECDLLPGRKRAPLGLRIAQRFRLLQKVNDLAIEPPGAAAMALDADQRRALIETLATRGDQTFAQIRKLLKLKRDVHFNLERGGEKKLPGHRTDEKLAAVFGTRWQSLPETDKDAIVDDLLNIDDEAVLRRRAEQHWGLDRESAVRFSGITLERDRAAFCRGVLRRLVGQMEGGTSFITARNAEFPHASAPIVPADLLPPVQNAVRNLRNPAVMRALTELRKVVNAIVGRYGKPDVIRIELARDLKRPRKEREARFMRNRERQAEREGAAEKLLGEMKIAQPSRTDIDKWLLADECNWVCPYTGRTISPQTLFGQNPQFDIEHILPLSATLDDSFVNRTLCYHEENRNRKRNHTPFQAFSSDSKLWSDIIARVSRFKGETAREKLRRFLMDDAAYAEFCEGFTSRQLNDTRYASRLAAEYCGRLYGGVVDAEGRRRVQVSTGGVTAHLRNEWNLNSILGLRGEKNRDDHRHHAVDALAIALSDPGTVRQLALAAEQAAAVGRRRFAPMPEPWGGFIEEARRCIQAIVVSRRPNRRLQGALHADSLYSQAKDRNGANAGIHIRKALERLTSAEVAGDAIVDPAIRHLVQQKLAALGGKPAQAFSSPANHPALVARNGQHIPIHKVRIRVTERPWKIGGGARERNVASKGGCNHHVAIVEVAGKGGSLRWADQVVSRCEAYARRRRGEPVVKRDWPAGTRFLFSLTPGEYVEMVDKSGARGVFRVMSVSEGDIELRRHSDGRTAEQVRQTKERIRRSAEKLREAAARKVVVTHLGDVRAAND